MRITLIVPCLLLIALIGACQPPVLYSPREHYYPPRNPATEALERFFAASGGLEQMRDLQSISCTATIESFSYVYEMHMLADGRFRVEAPDRTTVHDGREYWQSFYGLVHALTGDERERYEEISLGEVFLHGFLDRRGRVARLEYAGQESKRGQTWDVLTRTEADGDQKTFYLNVETGFLDKMIVVTPDPDLRELKTVYTMADYQDAGGWILPTRFQGQCLTNGEGVQPLTRFTNYRINTDVDPALFIRPASAAPPVTLQGDALHAQVLAISGGGSLITNVTDREVETLGAQAGDVLVAQVRGHEAQLAYMPVLESFAEIESGDYLATFNRTPALWLVKAYVGMTSDDSTYAAGDAVRLTIAAGPEEGTEQ